jgi:hypothetical protein
MIIDRRSFHGGIIAAALLAGVAQATAQTAYPARPIHLIVGFAAEGEMAQRPERMGCRGVSPARRVGESTERPKSSPQPLSRCWRGTS